MLTTEEGCFDCTYNLFNHAVIAVSDSHMQISALFSNLNRHHNTKDYAPLRELSPRAPVNFRLDVLEV